jgi:hypothetical protein
MTEKLVVQSVAAIFHSGILVQAVLEDLEACGGANCYLDALDK